MNNEVSKYLSKIGARGGAAKSAEKTETARANGSKGGRPSKKMYYIVEIPHCLGQVKVWSGKDEDIIFEAKNQYSDSYCFYWISREEAEGLTLPEEAMAMFEYSPKVLCTQAGLATEYHDEDDGADIAEIDVALECLGHDMEGHYVFHSKKALREWAQGYHGHKAGEVHGAVREFLKPNADRRLGI